MTSAKCPQCGMVNWAAEVSCKRCGAILSSGGNARSPVEKVISDTNPLSYQPKDYRAPAPPPQWPHDVAPLPARQPAAAVYGVQQPAGFRCRFCQSPYAPLVVEKISTGGWIVFAVMVTFCFPLCWIGLLMKENSHICSSCKMPLN